MPALRRELRLFWTALEFLTRVPVPRAERFDPAWLDASVRWFPWVGAAVGASGALVLWGAHRLWPPGIAATLAVAWTAWLTAAFHEDGLADTFDALLGAAPRERALEIMKDSRIGSYGAVVLVLTTLLRIGALAALLAQGVAYAAAGLVASHLLGRVAAVSLMALLPYAGRVEHAKVGALARRTRARNVVLAGLAGLAVFVLPLPAARAAAVLGVCLLLVGGMRRWLRRRLGGYTGDALGALEQLTEAAVLLTLAAG